MFIVTFFFYFGFEILQNLSEDSNKKKKSSTSIVDIDTLLKRLTDDGFSNTIQNIIVLKRFDNDYEKAINYLNSSNT